MLNLNLQFFPVLDSKTYSKEYFNKSFFWDFRIMSRAR